MPPAQDSLFLFFPVVFFSVRSGMDVEDPGRRVLLS